MEKKEISDLDKFREVTQEMEATTKWIKDAIENLDQVAVTALINAILSAPRIFFMGAGRSGLVAKALAMRLTHLGFTVFILGETTTPAVESDDLVIAVSGGGKTKEIVGKAEIISKEIGAKIAVITSTKKSTLGILANITIVLPGRAKDDHIDYIKRRLLGNPVAPLGTLFELVSMVFVDSLVPALMMITNQTEEEMKKRHAKPE